jgi:hypothetical protein
LRLKVEKEKAEAKERIKEERGFTGKVYPRVYLTTESFLRAHMQMQDLLDHGESRKEEEEVEFARIDAQAKDERDKQMGFRGKVCTLYSA